MVRSIVYGLLMCGVFICCKWYGNGKLLNEVLSNFIELVGVWNLLIGISRMFDMDCLFVFLVRLVLYFL